MHGSYTANMAIQSADLIIAFGSRFDDRSIGNAKKYAPSAKSIVLINNDKNVITGIKPTLTIHDDCKNVLKSLNNIKFDIYDNATSKYDWLNIIQKWKFNNPYGVLPSNGSASLTGKRVVSEVNKQLTNKNNVLFVTGVGNVQMTVAQYITFQSPGQLLTSGSLGVMGCAIPYSIGAKIADPSKTIITIDGDGNFNMSLNDLKTAMTYNIPLKVIIINNSALGMVKSWEYLFYNKNYTATTLKNPDFCKIAESYGMKSLLCNNVNDLEEMVSKFLQSEDSIILNAVVETENTCLPMCPPGHALHEMLM